jgi:hypothetical protein
MELKAMVGRKPRRAHDCTIAPSFLAPGSSLAPKGLKDSAQGFNPGFEVRVGKALKVASDWMRTDDWAARHPGRTRSGATREAVLQKCLVRIAARDRDVGDAFRAHRFPTVSPGLKLWAKSYRPFGAENALRVDNIGSVGRHPSLSLFTFHFSHSPV